MLLLSSQKKESKRNQTLKTVTKETCGKIIIKKERKDLEKTTSEPASASSV
jgi:hypothetical protein